MTVSTNSGLDQLVNVLFQARVLLLKLLQKVLSRVFGFLLYGDISKRVSDSN